MSDQTDIGVLLSKIALDVTDLKKGLREGREEMQSFKSMAQGVGESVKKAFAFAGIAVGIYEMVSALRDFAKEAAMTGARTETLEIAMNQVGKTYGVSAASLKFYVNELKGAGITTQESMLAVTKFLTSGLPLEKLKELATRARDIGVVANVNTSEALSRMIQGIITGEQETLRRLMIQVGHTDDIYKRYAATLGTTADQLNSVQKAQAILNEVMRLSAGFAGVAAESDASVGKQMASMARFAEEAKNSLWALFGPIMLEVIQQMTKGWQELKAWEDANKDSLASWGKSLAELIDRKIQWIAIIGKLITQNRELILLVLQFALFYKAAGWIMALTTALKDASLAMTAAATTASGLQTWLLGLTANPWTIAIMVTLFGLKVAYDQINDIQKRATLPGTERPGFMWPWQVEEKKPPRASGDTSGTDVPVNLRGKFTLEDLQKSGKKGQLQDYFKAAAASPETALAEARAAQQKAIDNAPKPTGKTEKGGKGAAGAADNLLAPTLAMYKAKREVELQDAQNSLDLLKSTNELKKAELDRVLAAQEIDGQAYYQRLQELQQQETAAALAMIAQKRQAQQKAYQDSLTELAADEKLSPEAKNIAQQKLEAENKKALAKLDTEAAQIRLEGEVKVTNELRRQVELKQRYQQKTEDLNLETAQLLGAISEQEASLQRLYLEWQRAKQEAIDKGAYTPEYGAALEANYQAKKTDAQYGGYASQITQGISSLTDALMSGGQDLMKAANGIFKNLFSEALKPGLDQLKGLLTSGFKYLFGEAGTAISSAVMGVIGLIGMLATSRGSSSSSPTGVTSAITSHEAVRGIIAGETSIPIAQIGTSLQDALVPTNGILSQIEGNTRGGGGARGGGSAGGNLIQINAVSYDTLKSWLDRYFQDYLLEGAGART
ncbi:MAG: phage tail tape measure protein [Desulfobaccales bacterium]